MKTCKNCGLSKTLDEFYPHPQMKDGHLNHCRDCVKKRVKSRETLLRNDSKWVNSERARGREKGKKYYEKIKSSPEYHGKRRQYHQRHKDKYPEKIKASSRASLTIDCPGGFHRHHWSYREEHWSDVIILDVSDHFLIHRYLKYDKTELCFRTLGGLLLDSKEAHLKYINEILKLEKCSW
jgi:hypothetical protein